MVIKIPQNKIKKIDIVNIQGGLTASEVYKKYKPDYMINLALYDMATGTNITHLKDEGVESGYLFSEYGIGIIGDKEIVYCHKSNTKVRDFVSGSPVLVENFQKSIDWGNKKSAYVCGSHIRSAIGFNANEIILFNSDKKMNLDELSQALISENCKFAINLDGGGSCHLQKSEKVYRKSTRANVSWLLVYLKEEKKMPKVFLGVGHGGLDCGAVANGLKESDINLNIALACKDVLEQHGLEVLLSRYKDENDPIEEEIKECNKFDADIAIDIHTNAGGGDGFEVYHHSGGHNSKRLAELLEVEARMLNNSRGMKTKLNSMGKDYYAFIRDTNPPAVIVECAFIDNKEDVKCIDTIEEQRTFGVAYAKGILKYFGIEHVQENSTKNECMTNCQQLVLTIDKKTYTVNGVTKELDVAPFIKDGRTLVTVAPLRELGLEVIWNGKDRTVTIRKGE